MTIYSWSPLLNWAAAENVVTFVTALLPCVRLLTVNLHRQSLVQVLCLSSISPRNGQPLPRRFSQFELTKKYPTLQGRRSVKLNPPESRL